MSPKTSRRSRGDGSLFQRASDGLWLAVVDLGIGGDGKRRRRTVSSKDYATAVKKLRALRRQVEDAGGEVPTASTTVAAWLDRWYEQIAAPSLRPKSRDQYASDLRLHIKPAVGKYRIDRLAPQHIRSMHAEIVEKGNSPTTARRCHWVLHRALGDAVAEGLITRDPTQHVSPPAAAVSTRRALTLAEGVTLLQVAARDEDGLGSRWWAALLTGARQGELLGLERDRVSDSLDLSWQLQRIKWRHGCKTPCGRKRGVDCSARRLDVPHDYEHRHLHGGLYLVRPKSRKGWRVVPVAGPLRASIERHVATTDPGAHNLVWSGPGGRPIDPRDDSKAWHDLLQRAGLPTVPLHSARHTTATLLHDLGVDGHTVEAILGHSSVTTTRAYQHVDATLTRKALEGLGAHLVLP